MKKRGEKRARRERRETRGNSKSRHVTNSKCRATGGQNILFDVAIDGERVTGKQKSEERDKKEGETKGERRKDRGERRESKRELTW